VSGKLESGKVEREKSGRRVESVKVEVQVSPADERGLPFGADLE